MVLMTFLFGVLSVAVKAQVSPAKKHVVIGYVAGFNGLVDADKISVNKLTHINYAFVNIKDGKAVLGREATDTVNFRRLNLLKVKNPSLKIFISIGGWAWSENFSDAVLTDSSRAIFASTAVEIIRRYGLDGVDIDWEYPGRPGEEGNVFRPEDKQNYTLMFKSLRAELDVLEKETGGKKLLSTAVGGFKEYLETTEMDKVHPYLDYINLMTYDMYTGGGRTTHHANLFGSSIVKSENSADLAVKAFIAAGVPVEKMVLGLPFYSRSFKVVDSGLKGLGEVSVEGTYGKGYTHLKDSVVNKNGFKRYIDKGAQVPYLFNSQSKTFVSYDDEWSIRNKCRYVLENGLSGVMFWEYSSDPKEYLLDEINKVLK